MVIKKYSLRYWGVYDNQGNLVCVTVYKKGAQEVVRRLDNKPVNLIYAGNGKNEKDETP